MYLHASEDENPIPQGQSSRGSRISHGEPHPGRIWGLHWRHRVRFYLPLRCQEPSELVEKKTGEQSRTVELFTDRGRILQMKLQEKNEGGTE